MNQPNPSTPPPQQEAPEVSFGQVFAVFWRGRWVILLSTLLCAGAGYWYGQQKGTIWRANSRIYVEKKGASNLGPESLLLGVGARNYANTQAEVVQSSEVMNQALKHFREIVTEPKIFGPDTIDLPWLKKNLVVKVGRDNDIITVSLESSQREEACELVNQVVGGYQAFQSKKQKSNAVELHGILEKDRERFEKDFNEGLTAQTEYRKLHPGVGPDSGGLTMLREDWRALHEELAKAENDVRTNEASWKSAKDLQADPSLLRQILPSQTASSTYLAQHPPEITIALSQLQTLERERLDFRAQGLTAEHYRVQILDEAIARLRKIIDDQDRLFAKAFVDSLEHRFNASKAKRDELLVAYQQKEKQVYALDAFESDYKRLQTKIDRAKESLDSVHQRLRQINVDDTDMTFVHVLDVAKPSTTEVASGQSLRLATGLIVGLLLGAVLAWIRGLIDQRIRTAEEVRFGLRMPILAILPRGKKGATKEGQTVLERWDLDSHYAEAARSLRTAVYFGMTQLQGNCVQVTSPDSGDGKTTIAANLAIAMAKAGQRTLLIDCDMRKPRQAERFGLDLSRGLTNVLADNMPLTDAIQGTAIPELHVLGSGPVPANPAELLNTPEMARLLDEVGKQYDRVIVDSPPILPVADARILASKCHASILALRVDKSTRRRAAAGRDALSAVGAKILGVALNDMPSGIGYGYGYGYGRYGSYGYGEYGDDRRPASYPDVGETENQKSVTGGLTGSQPAQAPRSRRSRRREPS